MWRVETTSQDHDSSISSSQHPVQVLIPRKCVGTRLFITKNFVIIIIRHGLTSLDFPRGHCKGVLLAVGSLQVLEYRFVLIFLKAVVVRTHTHTHVSLSIMSFKLIIADYQGIYI